MLSSSSIILLSTRLGKITLGVNWSCISSSSLSSSATGAAAGMGGAGVAGVAGVAGAAAVVVEAGGDGSACATAMVAEVSVGGSDEKIEEIAVGTDSSFFSTTA
jgi:hypothetical protein